MKVLDLSMADIGQRTARIGKKMELEATKTPIVIYRKKIRIAPLPSIAMKGQTIDNP